MKKDILFLLSLCLMIFSCSDEETVRSSDEETVPSITLNQPEITISNESSSQTISFDSNVSWTASSSESWCKVSLTSGDASIKSTTVTLSENDTYDDRNCIVSISGGSITQNVTITQTQENVILLSISEYEIKAEGDIIEIEFETNINVEVSIPAEISWVKEEQTSDTRGLEIKKIVLIIEPNIITEPRSALITLKDINSLLTQDISLYQAAKNITRAINVETPGIIKEILGDNFLSVEELIISGKINGADINIIREMAGSDRVGRPTDGALYKLDMSNAEIVEGGGAYYYSSHYGYDACYTSNDIITEFMFYKCNSLKEIILPKNIAEIKYSGISGCENLEKIKLNNSIKYIREFALSGNYNLTNINLPNTIEIIEGGAFERNISLEYITLPKNTKLIQKGVFLSCKKLKSIKLPNSVEYIGESAFSHCESLETIEIPNSTITIDAYAFDKCVNLKSVTFGENIETIKHDAFNHCDKITEIKCKNPIPPTLGYYLHIGPTFTETVRKKCKVYIPKGSYESYYTSKSWRYFENLIELEF